MLVSVWNFRLSLREMDQYIQFSGTIGYVGLYLDFFSRHFKVFRLHAIIHVAVRAGKTHSDKRSGYSYMIGRRPKLCLLGHVTGLLFYLHLKLFPPSIFNFVDFWSSMSRIVLDIELAVENVSMEFGFFIIGNVHENSFCPPQK